MKIWPAYDVEEKVNPTFGDSRMYIYTTLRFNHSDKWYLHPVTFSGRASEPNKTFDFLMTMARQSIDEIFSYVEKAEILNLRGTYLDFNKTTQQ